MDTNPEHSSARIIDTTGYTDAPASLLDPIDDGNYDDSYCGDEVDYDTI